VGAGNEDDGSVRAVGRNAERIALTLDDERRHGHRVQLRKTALGGIVSAAGRVNGEGKAEHRGRADFGGGPARDTRACGASTADHRQCPELIVAQLLEHTRPSGVELVRRSRATPPGNPVRLLDEHDAQPGRQSSVLRTHEVGRADAAARPVTEHERGRGPVDRMEVRPRGADRSLQLEDETSLAGGRPVNTWQSGAVATMADLDELALAMPQATKEVSEDGRPSYHVHGKLFCFHRSRRPDAIDPDTGERMDDVLMFRVADLDEKDLLLADDRGVFFTTPHFNGYPAVLMRIPTLERIKRDELRDLVVDAWLTRAQKRVAKAWLAENEPDSAEPE
jgi:hypothetical protein